MSGVLLTDAHINGDQKSFQTSNANSSRGWQSRCAAKVLHPGGHARWSPENTEALTTLWNEGKSASEIARRLHVTRNAVIGKVHRLGLPTHTNSQRTPQSRVYRYFTPEQKLRHRENQRRYLAKLKREGRSLPKVKRKWANAGGFNRLAGTPRSTFVELPENPAGSLKIPFLDTTNKQCKFMSGDDRACCGHPTITKRPYCEFHYFVSYRPR